MAISIRCPCGRQLRIKDELAGRHVKCPACFHLVLVQTSPANVEAVRATHDVPSKRWSWFLFRHRRIVGVLTTVLVSAAAGGILSLWGRGKALPFLGHPDEAAFASAQELEESRGSSLEAVIAAYRDYLRNHPMGRHVTEAQNRIDVVEKIIEDREFSKTRAEVEQADGKGPRARAACLSFLERFPKARHTSQVKKLLDASYRWRSRVLGAELADRYRIEGNRFSLEKGPIITPPERLGIIEVALTALSVGSGSLRERLEPARPYLNEEEWARLLYRLPWGTVEEKQVQEQAGVFRSREAQLILPDGRVIYPLFTSLPTGRPGAPGSGPMAMAMVTSRFGTDVWSVIWSDQRLKGVLRFARAPEMTVLVAERHQTIRLTLLYYVPTGIRKATLRFDDAQAKEITFSGSVNKR